MNKECSNVTMFKQITEINLGRTDENGCAAKMQRFNYFTAIIRH